MNPKILILLIFILLASLASVAFVIYNKYITENYTNPAQTTRPTQNKTVAGTSVLNTDPTVKTAPVQGSPLPSKQQNDWAVKYDYETQQIYTQKK